MSSSSLWNALEALIGAWAKDLEESLETNTEPDWDALIGDLSAAQTMASLLGERVRHWTAAASEAPARKVSS